ncbi:hypothetical protein [Ignatzschineria sp. LJL83]
MKIPFIRRPEKIFSDRTYAMHYSDNKEAFDYFEKTAYFEIEFNQNILMSMVHGFFTVEGSVYFLGLLIQEGYDDKKFSRLHESFVTYFGRDQYGNSILKLLTKKQRKYLLDWFLYLFDNSENMEDVIWCNLHKWQERIDDNIAFLKNYEKTKDSF